MHAAFLYDSVHMICTYIGPRMINISAAQLDRLDIAWDDSQGGIIYKSVTFCTGDVSTDYLIALMNNYHWPSEILLFQNSVFLHYHKTCCLSLYLT